MPETARPTRGKSRLASPALALCVITSAWVWGSSGAKILLLSMGSTAFAQPAGKAQLRAKVKSAAEKLNDIASAAPDMIRAMFAGNTSSANLLALDEKSIAAEAELEGAVLAAQKSGALSDDETKELARLGDVAKRTRGPVKEDLETLKSVPDLPIVGRDAAVRLAPKSQQDEVINNAEAAKKAVGALVAAIRKLP
jgi:3-methyladenine DNA glycosylase AlkC